MAAMCSCVRNGKNRSIQVSVILQGCGGLYPIKGFEYSGKGVKLGEGGGKPR